MNNPIVRLRYVIGVTVLAAVELGGLSWATG